MRTARIIAAVALVAAAACGSGTPAATPKPSTGSRPSSTAKLSFVQPEAGAELPGPQVQVVLDLTGARIVDQTSTDLTPDTGHIHLKLDGTVVSMTYGLQQDVPVTPGAHVLEAEFVAADHAPFNPRVIASVSIKVT